MIGRGMSLAAGARDAIMGFVSAVVLTGAALSQDTPKLSFEAASGVEECPSRVEDRFALDNVLVYQPADLLPQEIT